MNVAHMAILLTVSKLAWAMFPFSAKSTASPLLPLSQILTPSWATTRQTRTLVLLDRLFRYSQHSRYMKLSSSYNLALVSHTCFPF